MLIVTFKGKSYEIRNTFNSNFFYVGFMWRCGTSGLTLSWVIPNLRTNGAALSPTEIQGYRLCYTFNGGSELCESFDVDVPTRNSYTFSQLDPGVYRITLATIDTIGTFSARSEVLEHTLN